MTALSSTRASACQLGTPRQGTCRPQLSSRSQRAQCSGMSSQPLLWRSQISMSQIRRSSPILMRRALPEDKEQRFIQEAQTRHAVLHDFCLGIPGGVLLLVAGIAGRISGAGRGAAIVTLGGIAQIILSFLSLKAWRRQNLVLGGMLTTLQAGVCAFLSSQLLKVMRISTKLVPRIIHGVLLLISSILLLFLVYNLLAGGNPPPKGTKS